MENAINRLINVVPKTTIEQIKEKFNDVKYKKIFIQLLAAKFGIKPASVQSNWLGGFFSIPEKHQIEVLEFITNYLKYE